MRASFVLVILAACSGSPAGDDPGSGGRGGTHGAGGAGGSAGMGVAGSGGTQPRDCTEHVVIDQGVPVDDAAVAPVGGQGYLIVARQGGPLTILRTDAAGDVQGRPLEFGAGASPQLARAGPHGFVATVRDGRSLFAAFLVDDAGTSFTPIDLSGAPAAQNGAVLPAGDEGALITLAHPGSVDYTWVDAGGARRGSWHHQALADSVLSTAFAREGGVGVLSLSAEGALSLFRLEGPDQDTDGVAVFDRPAKRMRVVPAEDGGALVAALLDAGGETQLGVARIDATGRMQGAVNLGAVQKDALPRISAGRGQVVVTARSTGGTWSYWVLPLPLAAVDPSPVPVAAQNVLFLELDPPGVRVLAGREAFPVLVLARTCAG